MKVLLDSCVWGKAAEPLKLLGHDVVWTGSWPRDPGDEEILARAFAEERILVTLDKDFGELAILRNLRHFGILRLVGFRAQKQAEVCAAILASHGGELLAGAIITAERSRLRVRAPDPAVPEELDEDSA